MIRSESEYKEAIWRLKEQDQRLSEQKQQLEEMNLGTDEVKRSMDPLRSSRRSSFKSSASKVACPMSVRPVMT
jgi:hypothetical protein